MRAVAEEFQELAQAALDLQPWIIVKDVDPLASKEEELRVLQEKMLKELCDCVYALVGTAVAFDWDFEKAFKLVHEANMTKLKNGVEYVADGDKVKKSDTYEPPNLEECI